jgi:hypothetical protein
MRLRQVVAAAVFTVFGAGGALAAPILLFEQDFESPSGILIGNDCCTDITQQSVNALFGTAFQQVNTVETLALNGPAGLYNDPSGKGGDYALGLLATAQNDLLSLTFNTTGLAFLNMGWSISPVAADQPAGLPFSDTFGAGVPMFLLSLYDSPGGAFNLGALGSFALLDTVMITGNSPGVSPFDLNWSDHVIALNASGSSDGNVSIVFDLTAGGYAALDKIVIAASDIAGELPPRDPAPIPIPEPATIVLLACGVALIFLLVRLRLG